MIFVILILSSSYFCFKNLFLYLADCSYKRKHFLYSFLWGSVFVTSSLTSYTIFE